jgi:SAM-dependent methyltransferase
MSDDTTDPSVEDLTYMDLIGLVGETNRPPGGLDSVLRFVDDTALTDDDDVLEIGTSTGFTAIELARLIGCSVTGIDLNEESLAEARDRAETLGVSDTVTFERADATDLPYPEESFDVVCIGNVTAYVGDREAAVAEAERVLMPGGFFVAIPMYYHRDPSPDLLDAVGSAVGADIERTDKEYWLDLFEAGDLRRRAVSDFEFEFVPESRVEQYVDGVLDRADLSGFTAAERDRIAERYRSYLLLFRENLQHLRHSVVVYRKETVWERELFGSTPV